MNATPLQSPNAEPAKEPLPLTVGHAILSGLFKAGIVVGLQLGCTATGWMLWALGAPMWTVYAGCVVYAIFALPFPAFVAFGDFDSVPRDLGIKGGLPIFLFGCVLLWFCAFILPFGLLFAVFSSRKQKRNARQQMGWFVDKASQLVHS